MIHITIDTYDARLPSTPPRATLSKEGATICVAVEDIGDPEQEALSAARAIVEHFIAQYAPTR